MTTKEKLKLYFQKGDQPTQDEFWEWLESYWHKEEKIDIHAIEGLENGIPSLNDIYANVDADGKASLSSYLRKKMHIDPNTQVIPDSFGAYMSLTELSITNGVKTIGRNGFISNKLKSVSLPDSVILVDNYAFQYNQLSSLHISKNITEIGDFAFADNNLTSVTIPETITKINPGTFSNNELVEIIIPYSVIHIEMSAFFYNKLKNISIPDSVINIGEAAFLNNQLTSVVLGANTFYHVTSFDQGVQITGGKLIGS